MPHFRVSGMPSRNGMILALRNFRSITHIWNGNIINSLSWLTWKSLENITQPYYLASICCHEDSARNSSMHSNSRVYVCRAGQNGPSVTFISKLHAIHLVSVLINYSKKCLIYLMFLHFNIFFEICSLILRDTKKAKSKPCGKNSRE